MTDWVQDLADQVAAAGYIAVAPDLLSGMGPNGGRSSAFAGQSEVTEAVSKLNPDQITADLNAVADAALKFPVGKWQAVCVRFLLGWKPEFSLRDEPWRPFRRLCFLWTAAGNRRHGAN